MYNVFMYVFVIILVILFISLAVNNTGISASQRNIRPNNLRNNNYNTIDNIVNEYAGNKYNRRAGMHYYNQYNYDSYEDEYNNTSFIGDWIRARVRRSRALRLCKSYLTKESGIYKLRNKNVILTFDSNAKIMTCRNKQILGEVANVYWAHQTQAILNKFDNDFEEAFDTLCISFNEKSTYTPIKDFFLEVFDEVEIKEALKNENTNDIEQNTDEQKNNQSFENEYIQPVTNNDNRLNVNTASEEELTNLPGINIVMAKRIIKYRDLHSGFDSLAELYSEMKLKPHFQKNLNNLIYVEKEQNTDNSKNPAERIIDF